MVVPHSNSTSNHNSLGWKITTNSVVPHSNSTSNHNFNLIDWKISALFLIPILHQTTTSLRVCPVVFRCFLFQFYIKPQPCFSLKTPGGVVSYFNSTSNHNSFDGTKKGSQVVSYFNSTSNHNLDFTAADVGYVVSYFNSTSNHN